MPKGAPRRSNAERDGPCTPPLEQVLPLLLLGDHLTADSKLACFGTNKGMAEQLLRNAACTKLILNLGGAISSGGRISSRGARASVKAAQQLAAQSSEVALALHGDLHTPAACLWQHTTSIHLQGVQLSPKDLSSHSQLQLHKLPYVHTLSLQACHINAGPAAQQGPAAACSVRTLKCMRCAPSTASLISMALSLVDPGQLQTLITDDYAATNLLTQLPALQEMQLLPAQEWLGDSTFQQLLQHPGLTRVSLARLDLKRDYSAQPCSWNLTLTEAINVNTLAALPLANIQSCTMQGSFNCYDRCGPLDRAISNANRCPHLVFQPTTRHCLWTPAEPTFRIYPDDRTAARSISLVMRHMAHGALMVSEVVFRSFQSPAVVAALAAAPPTLTTLAFLDSDFDEDWRAVGEVAAGVCSRLPAHIRHVVVWLECERTTEQWQGFLRWFIKGVTRPLRLLLLSQDDYKWPAGTQQAMREWLSTHASTQVQLDLQFEAEYR